ncbi:uncharacterized protein LOC115983460 [Quercus lobata]|uniref:uncharacterized protein LOC115983460 n=1 Tax=Quercus lobata TaxID=97700 RepID=UPI001243B0BD|nr:uncharacterized protein LOC115983460 [Quercus lobata]
MGKKIQAMLESDTECKEETIDQPMKGVPKNTTCPAYFDSNSNSGNEAPNPGDGDLPMGFTIRVHLQSIPFSTMIATPICIDHHRTQKHLDPTLKKSQAHNCSMKYFFKILNLVASLTYATHRANCEGMQQTHGKWTLLLNHIMNLSTISLAM